MYIEKKRSKRVMAEDGSAIVAPEASELLFEAEDVADLLAEVTGEDVEVTVDDEESNVEFAVGEDVYTVTPEEDAEILEAVRRPLKNKKAVSASKSIRRTVAKRK